MKSLKARILIPIISVLLILVVALTVFVAIETSILVNELMDERITSSSHMATAYLASYESQTYMVASAMGRSRDLVVLVHRGDPAAIWQYTFDSKTHYGVHEIIIADANGITLARSHQRDNIGDNVSGVPSIAAGLRGEIATLYTPTPTAAMVMTSASPILDEGVIVGSVVVNYVLSSEVFVDHLAKVFNAEVTFFSGTERVATTIRGDNGQRAVGTTLDNEQVINTVIRQGQPLTLDLELNGEPHIAHYHPLKNLAGDTVGMFFVGFSTSYATSALTSKIIAMIIFGVVGLTAATVAAVTTANSITKPMKVFDEWMVLISRDGNFSWSPDEKAVLAGYASRRDEIGRLFKSYEQLTNFLEEFDHELVRVSNGELNFDVNIRSKDDRLSATLSKTVHDLNSMFREITTATDQVADGSQQVADGAQALAQGSTEQAASVEELSATISDIEKQTRDNADKAESAAELAHDIRRSAERGSSQMGDMVSAVNEINEASRNISKVIKVIDDIAFQTNILALNAAVEAARAGQHGKGFAVVAEEVRNLAGKSAVAAKDTGGLISASMEKAELGAKIANDTAESLTEIVSGIQTSTQLVGEIAASSKEQSEAISQINTSLDQVSQVIQTTSATAEESAAASEEMNGQSETLKGLMQRFKL